MYMCKHGFSYSSYVVTTCTCIHMLSERKKERKKERKTNTCIYMHRIMTTQSLYSCNCSYTYSLQLLNHQRMRNQQQQLLFY